MKRLYTTLLKDIRESRAHTSTLVRSLEMWRSRCDHDFKYRGHGHAVSYYTCGHCGIQEER